MPSLRHLKKLCTTRPQQILFNKLCAENKHKNVFLPDAVARSVLNAGFKKTRYSKRKKKKIKEKYFKHIMKKRDRQLHKQEIRKSQKLYKLYKKKKREGQYKKKKGIYVRKKLRSFGPRKKSRHVIKAKQMYKIRSVKPSKELSEKSGCSIKGMDKIIEKGEGAYQSSDSYANQTPESWSYARLASALTGGPASKVDYHILIKHCKPNSKALKLAIKPKKYQ